MISQDGLPDPHASDLPVPEDDSPSIAPAASICAIAEPDASERSMADDSRSHHSVAAVPTAIAGQTPVLQTLVDDQNDDQADEAEVEADPPDIDEAFVGDVEELDVGSPLGTRSSSSASPEALVTIGIPEADEMLWALEDEKNAETAKDPDPAPEPDAQELIEGVDLESDRAKGVEPAETAALTEVHSDQSISTSAEVTSELSIEPVEQAVFSPAPDESVETTDSESIDDAPESYQAHLLEEEASEPEFVAHVEDPPEPRRRSRGPRKSPATDAAALPKPPVSADTAPEISNQAYVNAFLAGRGKDAAVELPDEVESADDAAVPESAEAIAIEADQADDEDDDERLDSADEPAAKTTRAVLVPSTDAFEPEDDPDLISSNGGGFWTIPLVCLGLATLACCLILPAIEGNRRLASERSALRRDLESVQEQVSTNDDFLRKLAGDPTLAERLAQRQMKLMRPGTRLLPVGQGDSGTSPFDLVQVTPPPPMEPYQPLNGTIAKLCSDPHARLYLMGAGLFVLAAGLVLGAAPGPRDS